MEILAGKLAEILEITLEKAIELYPVIRGQFISYKILGSLGVLPFITWVGSLVVGFIGLATYCEYSEYIGSPQDSRWYEKGKEALFGKKVAITSCTVFIVGVLLEISLNILQYTLSPDFVMMKELL